MFLGRGQTAAIRSAHTHIVINTRLALARQPAKRSDTTASRHSWRVHPRHPRLTSDLENLVQSKQAAKPNVSRQDKKTYQVSQIGAKMAHQGKVSSSLPVDRHCCAPFHAFSCLPSCASKRSPASQKQAWLEIPTPHIRFGAYQTSFLYPCLRLSNPSPASVVPCWSRALFHLPCDCRHSTVGSVVKRLVLHPPVIYRGSPSYPFIVIAVLIGAERLPNSRR